MELKITDLGARPNTNDDTTPAVLAAMSQLAGHKNSRLVFPKGRYNFYRDKAQEVNLWTSNNDGGIKRIGLPVFNVTGLEIDGQGSQFVCHGRMVPLAIWDSADIRLKHFSIDWDRPFTLEARVVDQAANHIDLKMSPATPYVIRQGRLSGLDDSCFPQMTMFMVEYDESRKELRYDTVYPWVPNRAQELEPGLVRLTGEFPTFHAQGTVLMRMEGRHSVGISVGRSADVKFEDVALHASAGMGLIVQESRDLHLDNFRVTPTPGSGRILSTQDDATHFCNCRGHILIENCLLENCWDDAGNVHGIYRVINKRGPNWTVSEVRHFQQMGVAMGQLDDDLYEFVDPATMQTVHQNSGYDYKIYHASEMAITFRHDLPESVQVGMCIANLSATPDLTLRRNVIRNTRPGGFLVNTPGKVVIEENTFHTPGAAILVGADCNSWYESGAVNDILVRGNTFDNCRFMQNTCTPSPIAIVPAVPEAGRGKPFEKNIRIEENTFRAFDPLLLVARSVDGLTFRNNTIEHNKDYPRYSEKSGPTDIDDCVNVKVEGNKTND